MPMSKTVLGALKGVSVDNMMLYSRSLLLYDDDFIAALAALVLDAADRNNKRSALERLLGLDQEPLSVEQAEPVVEVGVPTAAKTGLTPDQQSERDAVMAALRKRIADAQSAGDFDDDVFSSGDTIATTLLEVMEANLGLYTEKQAWDQAAKDGKTPTK